MKSDFVVDANVLVYAYDRAEPAKRARARDVLDWLQLRRLGFLTTQVLGEFFCALTRNLATPFPGAVARAELEKHLRAWRLLPVTPAIVLEAARGAVEHQLAYWDAQLWATAKLNQISTVLTEDLQHQRRIEGVQFINPLIVDITGEE